MTEAAMIDAMVAVTAKELDRREQRVVLHDLTFEDYVRLADLLGHRPGVHLTYLRGTLEIMTTSPYHEHLKTLIARLVELFALLRGIRIYGYGSATYRRADAERGLEPDECYCIDSVKDVPDLAIEVVVTSGMNKLDVYAGLGVGEVWVFENGSFAVYGLEDGEYEPRSASVWFPQLDFGVLAEHAAMPDQDAAVRAYWSRLQ